jgi:hypothetical protein
MRILGVMTMSMIAAATACAGEGVPSPVRRVTVCTAMGVDFRRAQFIATGMFARIGVGIAWHSERSCPSDAIRIRLSYRTDRDFMPGALAYALPFEGIHIVVFYDRLQQPEPDRLPGLLAHVMVHEITHILQGVNRHSESGVMKAHWTSRDLDEIAFRPLPFTEMDVVLIHEGLDSRDSYLASLR